jgi:hypothetical protein
VRDGKLRAEALDGGDIVRDDDVQPKSRESREE